VSDADSYILEMSGIHKSFPGVKALEQVDFAVKCGEVHALMGENGAGKSTLVKILTGIYPRDEGSIRFAGREILPGSAAQAQRLGIIAIYQELNLIPYLSICENLYLGREPRRFGLIDWKAIERQAADALAVMGIGGECDLRATLYTQSVAIQQMVAIVRAVSVEARLLVMDEPTSSLNDKEVQILFDIIRRLKERRIAVVYITHRIDEVFEICDRVTVLRDGRKVGDYDVEGLTRLDLVSHMIGRDATTAMGTEKGGRAEPEQSGQTVCQARSLSRGRKVRGVDLELLGGQVLGLAGLLGSGRTELARVLFGDEKLDEGQIRIRGRGVRFRSPRDAVLAGLALCPEDRKAEGIVPHMSVQDNIVLAILPRLHRLGIASRKRKRQIAEALIAELGIKTTGPAQMIRNLSGGNQQKVLLARWLCAKPLLLILDEPTRGIDVGAKAEVQRIIRALAAKGMSLLMISSEIEELIRNCERVAVLRDGRKVGELEGEEVSGPGIAALIARAGAGPAGG
jgi:ABC-type sugar transport system ATPase subunit